MARLPESQQSSTPLPPEPTVEAENAFSLWNLCEGIDNSNRCARAIEKHQLENHPELITREDDTLYIFFPESGHSPVVLQDTFDGIGGRNHNYREYLPSLDYHVVELNYYEGRSYLLVSSSAKQGYEIASLPIVSPNGKNFITVNPGRGRTSVEIWNRQIKRNLGTNRLSKTFVWHTENFRLKYENHKPNYMKVIYMAEWLDKNQIKIDMIGPNRKDVSVMIKVDSDGYVEELEIE